MGTIRSAIAVRVHYDNIDTRIVYYNNMLRVKKTFFFLGGFINIIFKTAIAKTGWLKKNN